MSKIPEFKRTALVEFLVEAEEQLERITMNLSMSGFGSVDPNAINALYRELHSLKGNAQLFNCGPLAQVAHNLECAIDSARKNAEDLYPELADEIYRGVGLLERMVKTLKASEDVDYTKDATHLISQLTDIISRHHRGAPLLFGKGGLANVPASMINASSSLKDVMDNRPPVDRGRTSAAARENIVEQAADLEPPTKVSPMADERSEKITVPALVEKQSLTAAPSPAAVPAAVAQAAENPANETLRVQVNLLDSLMNLVGELVLVRNQVIQKSNSSSEDSQFVNLSQRLDVITTELQNEIMKTRMQPIGTILTKFHRLVRDLSRDLNKEIILKLEGTETELDKTLVEAVKDPLTHIIRNSIDHGIETKEDRLASGKNKSGTVQIRAFHEGGQIVIEISDDGRGLQRQKIGNKAVERGLITAEAFKKMSDREVCQLIFLPGFSTAEKVSNISGRGVGMDVVRTNIEKIGGVVDITSVEGHGSTFRLKIPLTLAIVPALLVKSAGQSFAIPQVKLTELVRLQGDERSENRIEYLQGQAVFRLRGKLLPLVSLGELFSKEPLAKKQTESSDTSIVVLQADAGVFGLIVDEIDDSTDIVVKSLSSFLKNLNVYSGATVLGDGSVALVLDVAGLAEYAKVFSGNSEIGASDSASLTTHREEITEYLLVDIGVEGRYSIPLYVVNRLEEFPRSLIEYTGDQLVVRYRDSILPLLNLANILTGKILPKPETAYCSVIVVQHAAKLYGLIVDSILDIIGIAGAIDETVRDKPCLLGTKIHANQVITVLDAFKIIQTQFPIPETFGIKNSDKPVHVLYAEDSEFFQRQIAGMLEHAGFIVTCAIDGEEAYNRLQNDGRGAYQIVVSDLDMPVLDGFGLAEKIRAGTVETGITLVALSSRAKGLTEKQAMKSGFDRYIEKSDVANLIEALRQISQPKLEVKRGA